jgi:hypothetical protein
MVSSVSVQVSGLRPDDVENDQIPQSVICLLTPDT